MCYLFNGDGIVFTSISCNGWMCYRSFLGFRSNFISHYCQICSTLEIHTTSYQYSNHGNHFLHLVIYFYFFPSSPPTNLHFTICLEHITFEQIVLICSSRMARKTNIKISGKSMVPILHEWSRYVSLRPCVHLTLIWPNLWRETSN